MASLRLPMFLRPILIRTSGQVSPGPRNTDGRLTQEATRKALRKAWAVSTACAKLGSWHREEIARAMEQPVNQKEYVLEEKTEFECLAPGLPAIPAGSNPLS